MSLSRVLHARGHQCPLTGPCCPPQPANNSPPTLAVPHQRPSSPIARSWGQSLSATTTHPCSPCRPPLSLAVFWWYEVRNLRHRLRWTNHRPHQRRQCHHCQGGQNSHQLAVGGRLHQRCLAHPRRALRESAHRLLRCRDQSCQHPRCRFNRYSRRCTSCGRSLANGWRRWLPSCSASRMWIIANGGGVVTGNLTG